MARGGACMAWHFLFLLAMTMALPAVNCQQATRSGVSAAARVTSERLSRPFLKVRDTVTASSQQAQLLYEQASSISNIAGLLLGAADPLSKVDGSSGALLPYLGRRVLRVYASQPGRCSSALVEQLYGLTRSMYGTPELQACHADLIKALGATFTWVADNIPLAYQDVPGQPPQVTAAWPDLSAISDADFAAAVSNALLTQSGLAETATLLASGRCGLDIPTFSSLVPSISSALTQLHADLADLKRVMEDRVNYPAPYTRRSPVAGGSRRSAAATIQPGAVVDDKQEQQGALRRELASFTSVALSYVTEWPPASFNILPPSAMPKLSVPIVLHVLLYKDGNATGPQGFELSPMYTQRMLRILNLLAKPTNISFFIRELRYNATAYPYLLLKDRKSWLQVQDFDACTLTNCLYYSGFTAETAVDFPRSINIYISSDSSVTRGPLGYTSDLPPSDVGPARAYISIPWDQFTTVNSDSGYNDGVQTFLHEIFHFLGLDHTFNKPPGYTKCMDGDFVADTPIVSDAAFSQKFWPQATLYCLGLYWNRFGGDMESMIQRASVTLGIPDLDKNAWADSCPNAPGYDELGNYMTYTTASCLAALGHFTPGQVQRAHYITSEYQPLMYAWGQYYASQAAPPPPQLSPPPASLEHACRNTAVSGCPCKSSWQGANRTFSFCDSLPDLQGLWCEVANPETCWECPVKSATTATTSPCYAGCAGTPQMCKRPPNPPAGKKASPPAPPPPPRPPSPPPMPPPPPPDNYPAECKVSASECACRRSWSFNGMYGNYCSPVKGSTVLRCIVTPDCPTFADSPLQKCSPALTAKYCAGSQGTSPPPPPPKRSRSPKKPATRG